MVAALSLAAVVSPTVAVASGQAPAGALPATGTSLPAAWEICILENLGAPVTATTVADLDVWQVGEGGSTQNDNSFNPFNTKRSTDASGTALPAALSPDGFPAFANWPAGCAATTATILQSNMAAIRAALAGGGQSPPSAFLSTVDRTPWCAPDNGQPCYASLIALASGFSGSSRAMDLLANTSAAVGGYGRDVSQLASLENTLGAQQAELVAARVADDDAGQVVQGARQALRTLAVYDYTSNPTLDRVASLDQFETPTQSQQLRQFYERVDLTSEVDALARAQSTLRDAQAHTAAVLSAVAATRRALSVTGADLAHWVARLAVDVGTLHSAGGCPAVPAVPAVPGAAGGAVTSVSGCLHALSV